MFDFDSVTDRRGTDSLKHDFAGRRGMPADVLPLWVADMDFPAPPCVTEALEARSRHGIFGYSETGPDYTRILKGWFSSRFGWEPDDRWLVKTPGVVCAIHTAIRAFTSPGDGVLIQQPVYYPFASAVRDTGRRLVVSELLLEDGRYTMDWDDLDRKLGDSGVKLMLLCSPHNPVGRVWTRQELLRLGDLCLRHGVLVVADEIHQDFVYPGHTHTVFAGLRPQLGEITVTCTAPSKTFNLAGLMLSNIFIQDDGLRRAFQRELGLAGLSQMDIMGITACKAAYAGGGPWLEALVAYLGGTVDLVREFLQSRLPEIRLVEPEGTYLLWLDMRALGLSGEALDRLMVQGAGLWLDGGTMFGAGGEGFQRVNIASPRAVIRRALEQLERAVRDR